ncbi:MAG: hypothetical protein AAGD05_00665, partial [Bacteroidota bacterium]
MKNFTHPSLIVLLALISSWSAGYGQQCGFSISDPTPCGLTIVNFSVNNPGIGYSWDMNGDGIADAAGSSAFYIYPFTAVPISYTVTLYANGIACATETVIVQPPPDPSIGVIPGNGILTGNQIRVCSGSPDATLSIFNASTTLSSNQSYTINWGDGSSDTFQASEFTASDVVDHDYSGFGYYTITVTTTSLSGCQALKSYLFYNGSNPSVGMANPGNTVGLCVPATITFPITNTENNPTGTIYNVYISGVLVATYTQENIPAAYTYTFLETSCGKSTVTGNYQNAYDIQIVATNPCGSSQATIEPIELSSPPELEILLDEPEVVCVEDAITLTNGSTGIGEVVSGNPSTCSTNLSPSWTITPGVPGVHWNIISGNTFSSDELEIEFLIPGDYTVTMTINSQACGAFSVSQELNIIESPDASAIATLVNTSVPSTADECAPTIATFSNQSEGDSLTFEWVINPTTGWEYWNNTDETATDLELLFIEPGTYLVGLKATNECKTAWWDTTLVIASIPVIALNPIPDFCETASLDFHNGNVQFNANGGTFTDFNWSFPGATPASSTNQFPNNIQYDMPGEYIVSLQATNQCGSMTVQDTFVVVQPGSLLIDNDYIVCANDPGFAISASPSGGHWSGTGVDANGWYSPSENNTGTHTLVYTFNQGSCSLSDSLQVTVLPLPTLSAGPNQSACVDETSIIISGGSPAGGQWTVDNGGVITGSNNFDASASGPGWYTLTYTFTDANNCTNSASKTLLINDLPTVEAGPDQTLCNAPANVQLSNFSPAGGTWSGTGVTPSGVFNPMSTPGLGTYVLYYTFTNSNTTCTNVDSLTITIVETTTVEAGPNRTVCVDGGAIDLSLAASPAGGTWSANGSDGLFGEVFNPAVAGVGTHVLSYSYGEGSCAATDNLNITVFALPNVNAGQDQAVCSSQSSLPLIGTPSGGNWTANNGGQLNGDEFLPNASGAGNYRFTYTYTNANGCSASDEVEVLVRPLPTLQTNDTLYCNTPGLVSLPYASPIGGSWNGPGISNNSFDPQQAGGTGNYVVAYTFTDVHGCLNTISANIEVIDPSPADAGADFSLCIDQTVFDLNSLASPAGGVWTSTSTGLDGTQFDPALAGVGQHQLTYSFGTGNCATNDQLIITVYPLPQVFAGQDLTVCSDATDLILSGNPTGGTWTANNGGLLIGDTFSPSASGPGNYHFTYTYTNANGCTRSDDMEVVVNALPTLLTNDTVYCSTPGLVALPYTTPVGGTWSGLGVSNNFFDPPGAGGAGFYTLVYDYTDGNGCSNQIDATIQVIAPAPVFAGPDVAMCIDQPAFDLNDASSPPGGTWTSTSPGLNGSIFDPVLAGPGKHLLTYRMGNGNCEVSDNMEIRINPLPQVFAGQDRSVCVSQESLQLIGVPQGGTWTANTGGVLTGSTFSPSASGVGNYLFTYTYTNPNGCIFSDQVDVAVNALPILTTNDTTYCNTPGLVALPHSTPTGGSWSGDGVFNNFFDPQAAGGAGFYTLTYSYTNPNGCSSTIESNIQVVLPNPLSAGNDRSVCIDAGPIDLSQNAFPTGGNWFTDASNGLSGSVFDPASAGPGTHLVVYSQGTGNCEVQDSLLITVHALPQVYAGIDQSVCFGTGAFVLQGANPPGGSWSG